MYLGLTGNIASGKSTVAKMFESLGCYTIDADEISRIVMKKGEDPYFEILKHFGEKILREDGEIDRQQLKNIIFDHPTQKNILEEIVHPAIHKYEKKLVSEIKGRDDKAIIITHGALIIEKGTYKRFDRLIVVYADENTSFNRLIKRDNIDSNFANKIISSQMPIAEKLKYANFIVNNNGTLKEAEEDVKRVFSAIKIYKYCKKHTKNLNIF